MSIEEVHNLLAEWNRLNSELPFPQDKIVQTLNSLSSILEAETKAFYKKDPDPYDTRHPSRQFPDCSLGQILKAIFKHDQLVDEMIKVYCQQNNPELNVATTRLMLDILPGLDSIVFTEEGFLPRLYEWTESADEPLRTSSTALIAASLVAPEVSQNYKEKNALFVPMMLRRLKALSLEYLEAPEEPPEEFREPKIPERPFASVNGNSLPVSKHQAAVEENNKYTNSLLKRKASNEVLGKSFDSKRARMGNPNHPLSDEGSNSNWADLEHQLLGNYQIYPVDIVVKQRAIFQFLTPLGEYQDFLGVLFEENVLQFTMQYINLHQNPDIWLCFDALKYTASLLCHKKVALEFLSHGGLEALLKVPYPSVAATGVSICFYYLSCIEEAMERICLLPPETISKFIEYALWLVECSHESSQCHATLFFSLALAFEPMLEQFDAQGGLRKLFNILTVLDIFAQPATRTLSEEQIYAQRQASKNTMWALKKYFEAHLALKVNNFNCGVKTKNNKGINLSNDVIESYMDTWRQNFSATTNWRPVDAFNKLDGISFLLEVISEYSDLNFYFRNDAVNSALDIIKICTLTVTAQLTLCDKLSPNNNFEQRNVSGIYVLLQATDPETAPSPSIQRSVLHVIINCVCTRIPVENKEAAKEATPKRKPIRSIEEDVLNKMWKAFRMQNGIITLINLLSCRTSLTDADAIRSLACRALCGIARSEHVKQIITKLQLVTEGHLMDLMREPVIPDKHQEHAAFSRYGTELLSLVTDNAIVDESLNSLMSINKNTVVSKTNILYNKSQLMQLIVEHLKSEGFEKTAECLDEEIKSTFSDNKESKALQSIKCLQKNPSSPQIGSKAFNSTMSTPNSKISLKLTKKKSLFQTPLSQERSGRLQKSQFNYFHSPVIKKTEVKQYYGESQPSITLDSIITDYLRKKHGACKHPMLTCPPFDLLVPHQCPDPKSKVAADKNFVMRFYKRQMHDKPIKGGSALDKKLIYSRFRLLKTFRGDDGIADFSCCCFKNFDSVKPSIFTGSSGEIGSFVGKIKSFYINSGEQQFDVETQSRHIGRIETSRQKPLLVTSDNGRYTQSSLWKYSENNIALEHSFNDVTSMEFFKTSSDRMVGTKQSSSVIYDTMTLAEVTNFNCSDGNNYITNHATMDYSDEYLMSDGLIFDVRSGELVHKILDKFNATFNGVFHPNGREIISNSEIWDMRTYKLLQTVNSLDNCKVVFNASGNVIYAVTANKDTSDGKVNCFYTFDANDYSPISTIDVKRAVFCLATDEHDRYIATVEHQNDSYLTPVLGVDCVTRVYEVGRGKVDGDDSDDGESDDGETDDNDDGDSDDEEYNDSDENDNNNDDGNNNENRDDNEEEDIFELSASDIDSSGDDDDTYFSLNII